MQKRERLFILAILASSACGGRIDNPEPTTSAGGLSTIGGTIATGGSSSMGGYITTGSSVGTGGSPSMGGSTSTDTSACPSEIPQAGDPCLPPLSCVYNNTLCFIAYQCSASGEFEWIGDCPSTMGGASSTGGSSATGGTSSSTGGTKPTGGATSLGGTTSMGGSGSGCTGSFEKIQTTSGLCVAKMATISAPSGYSDYQIDVTEVTKGQYDSWLATNPLLPASTDANCDYVTTYVEQGTGYMGTEADHHPVVYVDWCDSYTYCSGVGKRLCGAIGGGSNSFANYADATQNQWYRVCSSGGTNAYPYGNTYQSGYCNGSDYGPDQSVVVGSFAACVTSTTGYAGAYDLSGNVDEWEDSCESTGNTTTCHIRGGSFLYDLDMNFLRCGVGIGEPRSSVDDYVGFRCCSP